MAWLILGAVLLALILLVFFVSYGVDAAYIDQSFSLRIKAGPFRFRIFPQKPLTEEQQLRARRRKEKKEAKKLAKAAKKAEKGEETLRLAEKGPPDLETILALLKLCAGAVRRLFRCFTVDFFQLRCTVATGDPYDTAMQYAYACSAVEALPELCGDVIRVRRRDIRIGSDFTAEGTEIAARLVLSMRLFRLVALAAALGVEYLSIKRRQRRKQRRKAMERKDDNGAKQDRRDHGYDLGQDPAVG